MIADFASTTVLGTFQSLSSWVFYIQFNCEFPGPESYPYSNRSLPSGNRNISRLFIILNYLAIVSYHLFGLSRVDFQNKSGRALNFLDYFNP